MGAGIRGLILFVVFGGVVAKEEGATTSAGAFCSRASLAESFLQADGHCSASGDFAGVAEGDEGALTKALHLVHKNKGDYVALLFYASWCPFSKICRPNFNNLAMSFPNVHHFAFEESAVKPRLSRLGVHGFPALFLLNSTVQVRYHGPRTTSSLVAFYSIVTGNNPIANSHFWENTVDANPREFVDFENCPFSWARSPEKLLQQDTYLVLATVFLVARFLYFLVPKLLTCFHHAWRRHIRYASLMSLCQACLEQGKHAFSAVNHCKSQNGAINARAWASKSLASVSIGEPSSGRV